MSRAIAAGTSAAFAGKAFLWDVGALATSGPSHVIRLLKEELTAVMHQIGAGSVRELADTIHRGTNNTAREPIDQFFGIP